MTNTAGAFCKFGPAKQQAEDCCAKRGQQRGALLPELPIIAPMCAYYTISAAVAQSGFCRVVLDKIAGMVYCIKKLVQ